MISYYLPLNQNGDPVSRSKKDYPYSYDGFVVHRLLPNQKEFTSIWSDHLCLNYPLYQQLYDEFFQNKNFNTTSPQIIEEFLQKLLNNPKLRLILVMEYCNLANGCPVWKFDYCELLFS